MSQHKQASKYIKRTLSVAMAVGLVIWLLRDVRTLEALKGLLHQPIAILASVTATQAVSYLCRSGRLYSQFNKKIPMGFLGYLRVNLLHNMSVNVVPFRGGEAALPLLLQRAGLPFSEGLATLVWLRIQDLFVLGGMATLLWPNLPLPLRLTAFALVPISAFACGKLFSSNKSPLVQALRESRRFAPWIAAIEKAFDASFTSWAWSTTNWVAKLLGLAILLSALTSLPYAVAAGGSLGGELSALLPIQGVAGFGTYEAGVVFLLHLGNGQWNDMFVSAFALHCFTLFLAIVAGCLAWLILPAYRNDLQPISPSRIQP